MSYENALTIARKLAQDDEQAIAEALLSAYSDGKVAGIEQMYLRSLEIVRKQS